MTLKEQQVIDILLNAMNGGNLIRFEYDGQISVVEPYLVGELYDKFQNHLEEGKFALRAWFVRDYSNQPTDTEQGERWRIYELDKMTECETLIETKKNIRPLYNPDDKKFKRINFRVKLK
jgi:hypothetical protein